jgi:hypothetical protein
MHKDVAGAEAFAKAVQATPVQKFNLPNNRWATQCPLTW